MIAEVTDYWKEEVKSRVVKIVFGPELWLAVVVALAFGYYGPRAHLDKIKVTAVVSAALNYSAIAFGFAVTGMTLAISIPHRTLTLRMAKEHVGNSIKCLYSDLLFVFSWTALAHLFAVLLFLLIIAFIPDDRMLFSIPPLRCERIAACGTAFVVSYCLFQFCITIITLSQVGAAYIEELKKEI